jgi:citrate/tricarballylate utilization protein
MPEPEPKLFEEANRQLVICNACRYCEGLCPVFRAVETRRDFARGDVLYLANLCHDCRACYYACMFTPPHEFAINIPQLLSEARIESYKQWSWPNLLARAFKEPRITLLMADIVISLTVLVALLWIGPRRLVTAYTGPGSFYAIVPYLAMVLPALALYFFGIAIWLRGAVRAWSETNTSSRPPVSAKALAEALGAVLTLRHLEGGGPGCTYPEEQPSAARRIHHAFVFWGFLADLVSTTLAFIYQDFLHQLPPYPLTSEPVIFGSVGGVLLIVGTAGLIAMKRKSDRIPATVRAYTMDYAFLSFLALVALTGLFTLIFRATAAMGSLLVLHLALVAALFITAPYGKFVHAVYRTLALVRYYAEQGQLSH